MKINLKPLPFRSVGSAMPPAWPEGCGASFTRHWVGVGQCLVESKVLLYFPTPTPPLKGRGL